MRNLILILCFIIFPIHSQAANKRYIITGLASGTSRTSLPNTLPGTIKNMGGKFLKNAKHYKAAIALLPDSAVRSLKRKFFSVGIKIEEDTIYKINFAGKRPGKKPPKSFQNTPWGITRMNADRAHSKNKGAGVTVCVVDTGVSSGHEDLKGNVIGGENFVEVNGSLDSDSWEDDHSHGTHVSGTIAALDNNLGVIGVAPEANIFGVKVLDKNGSGYSSDVADGILSCVKNKTHVINMSLGGSSPSDVIENAVNAAISAGIKVIAAAGNDGGVVGYPAAFPGVIAVSALDENDDIAYFSNRGSQITYIAPGTNVSSTVLGNKYASYNGTSMATPHVAGLFALSISSKSKGVITEKVALDLEEQGQGVPDADLTVENQ